MSTIFMVTSNTVNVSEDMILGFYPTKELAEARKATVLADPDFYAYGDIEANETDFSVAIIPVPVAATGADVNIQLR